MSNLYEDMMAARNVHVKPVNNESNIYACNFTRSAFREGDWDEYSSKARGLFVRNDGTVVMRGFDKFFNIGENDETTMSAVLNRVRYPVRVERKQNGFLGLIGAKPHDANHDCFRFYSKSGETDYSALIERVFNLTCAGNGVNALDVRDVLRKNNVTLACEIIDVESDKHIIHYDSSRCYFLHCINNTQNFSINYGAERELRALTVDSMWPQAWIANNEHDLVDAIGKAHDSAREGVVIYSNDGYMAKVKSDYYLRVKAMRAILTGVLINDRDPDKYRGRRGYADAGIVLAHADRSELVYHREELDNEENIDMVKAGDILMKYSRG